ncbi:hypothetical protein NQ314_006532 [Rhamnusium bicolor]|uniref:Multivesicular body subunit 12A n=1 Tax=Rhamnusium bicolor TaxID=1586634 RepID=A0AAV8Z199_9CUCU|nr:hypothetical protein NQ314_006532 [Rhamnusium bicolor]
MLKSSVQHKILNSLPDDRPITAIQINALKDFFPISRTYDQDSDADLRESSIFKSSSARYLCLSKTEGLPNFVVQEILVLTDKANPPKGFSLLNRTADSEQKAWKKKQICYRLVNKKQIRIAITDIIICSRLRKAPAGFSFAGELNGVTICYKMGNVQDSQSNSDGQFPPERPPKTVSTPPSNPMYPSLGESDHDYEILRPGYPSVSPSGPTRPAPKPPAPPVPHQNSTHTLGTFHNGLEGVPFIVNPKCLTSSSADKFQFPRIKAKTMQQILKDYDYPFTVERQT